MKPLCLLHRRQVHRRHLAAPINLKFEFQPVAFVERRHAGAFNRRDVHERIGLAVIALDEAKTLHRVEELDRARCLFARQLTLRTTGTGTTARAIVTVTRRAAIGNGQRLTFNLQVGRRDTATAIDEREAERLTFGQAGQAGLLNR